MLYNIYFSPTGGTKKVADILVSNLTSEFCEVDICRDIEKMSLQAEDVCLISVPSFAGAFRRSLLSALKRFPATGRKRF